MNALEVEGYAGYTLRVGSRVIHVFDTIGSERVGTIIAIDGSSCDVEWPGGVRSLCSALSLLVPTRSAS